MMEDLSNVACVSYGIGAGEQHVVTLRSVVSTVRAPHVPDKLLSDAHAVHYVVFARKLLGGDLRA